MKSKFEHDKAKEEILGQYLDAKYPELFKAFNIERVTGLEFQMKGVDLVIKKGGKSFYIDEKAQLDYPNQSLPTFAFELSYLKGGNSRLGWLLDENKITDHYFLITGIFLNEGDDINKGIKHCELISVDRAELLKLLDSKGLTKDRLIEINNNIRKGTNEGRIDITELNPAAEGRFYFSKSGKAEQPINLVLFLNYLIKSGVAKKII